MSERFVLINSPDEKNMLCSTIRAPATVHFRAYIARTAHCGYHKKKSQYRRHAVKQLNGDKRRVQCSSCCDLNASHIPELIKQLSTPQQKLPGETWLSTARPSLKHHTHCDQSSVGVFVGTLRHTKRMPQTEKRSAWLFTHSLQNNRHDQ